MVHLHFLHHHFHQMDSFTHKNLLNRLFLRVPHISPFDLISSLPLGFSSFTFRPVCHNRKSIS
ncbi:hypothetical protein AHAS_Ahas05G0092200 [Arachis hypogaea]